MIAGGLWKSRPRKLTDVHPWRPRRSAYGELVQWDTSDHDWLEGRGERVRYLVRLIDGRAVGDIPSGKDSGTQAPIPYRP
jgi:hypothetical protein